MLFTSLGLSDPILKAIEETGYTAPTPIQAKVIPLVLEGGRRGGGGQSRKNNGSHNRSRSRR